MDEKPRYCFSTGAFNVAGVGTDDFVIFSRLLCLVNEKPPRNLATKFFEIYVLILGVILKVYLSLQKLLIPFTI